MWLCAFCVTYACYKCMGYWQSFLINNFADFQYSAGKNIKISCRHWCFFLILTYVIRSLQWSQCLLDGIKSFLAMVWIQAFMKSKFSHIYLISAHFGGFYPWFRHLFRLFPSGQLTSLQVITQTYAWFHRVCKPMWKELCSALYAGKRYVVTNGP